MGNPVVNFMWENNTSIASKLTLIDQSQLMCTSPNSLTLQAGSSSKLYQMYVNNHPSYRSATGEWELTSSGAVPSFTFKLTVNTVGAFSCSGPIKLVQSGSDWLVLLGG